MHNKRTSGFTLVELMIVVALVGITAVFAVPSWQTMQNDGRAKGAARTVANALTFARSQAIMSENNHIVYFNIPGIPGAFPAGTDICGTPLPGPIVILDDGPPAAGPNCCIDPAETVVVLPDDPNGDLFGITWGATFAAAAPNEDSGPGVMATGSTFGDGFGAQTRWVTFRPDGTPVGFDTACVQGQVGTGRGAIYVTNGGFVPPAGPTPGTRDYAIVLAPLGTSKIFSWERTAGAWTQ